MVTIGDKIERRLKIVKLSKEDKKSFKTVTAAEKVYNVNKAKYLREVNKGFSGITEGALMDKARKEMVEELCNVAERYGFDYSKMPIAFRYIFKRRGIDGLSKEDIRSFEDITAAEKVYNVSKAGYLREVNKGFSGIPAGLLMDKARKEMVEELCNVAERYGFDYPKMPDKFQEKYKEYKQEVENYRNNKEAEEEISREKAESPYEYFIKKIKEQINAEGKRNNKSLLSEFGLPDGEITAFGCVNTGLLIQLKQNDYSTDNTNFYMLKNGHLAAVKFINIKARDYRKGMVWKTVNYKGGTKSIYREGLKEDGYRGHDDSGECIHRDKKALCMIVTLDNEKMLERDFPLSTNYSDVRKELDYKWQMLYDTMVFESITEVMSESEKQKYTHDMQELSSCEKAYEDRKRQAEDRKRQAEEEAARKRKKTEEETAKRQSEERKNAENSIYQKNASIIAEFTRKTIKR